MKLVRLARRTLGSIRDFAYFSGDARREIIREWRGFSEVAPEISPSVNAALRWLTDAQDGSSSKDGGVASYFSIQTGWSDSYPETTGYIVPTFLEVARDEGRPELRERARRMLDWLCSLQFENGAFPGGTANAKPQVPVTFNTGQILMGLASGAAEFGDPYLNAMRNAADWLVRTQDGDGCWRSNPSPFTAPGDKSYETHVAWGLLQAEKVSPGRGYIESALSNVRWALSRQIENGWFENCCLNDPTQPLTHTIGYALRGCVEAYRSSGEAIFLDGSRRTADSLLRCMGPDGRIAGRLDQEWNATVPWVCLTGTVQIAHCWILLYEITAEKKYLDAARVANSHVRRTVLVDTDASEGFRGGIRGSLPIRGGYCPYWYINWAAKFFIDSHRAELAVAELRTPGNV